MCNFLSAVFINKGGQIDMLCDPEHTDSHSVLIAAAGLKDDETSYYRQHIAKCELTPPYKPTEWKKLDKWIFKVDEREIPGWLNQDRARDMMERQVAQMFIKTQKKTLLGGCWILDGKKASLKQLVRGRIVAAINGANLSGANLSRADLSRADLSRADLSGADLSRADLSGADLSRADLSGAYLSRADLYGADLYGADLSGADLSYANMSYANMSGARNYILPPGWSIDQNEIVTKN